MRTVRGWHVPDASGFINDAVGVMHSMLDLGVAEHADCVVQHVFMQQRRRSNTSVWILGGILLCFLIVAFFIRERASATHPIIRAEAGIGKRYGQNHL